MNRIRQNPIVPLLIAYLFSGLIGSFPVEAKTEAIRFDGPQMSVDIDEINLKDVFNRINEQKEFQVKGDPSLLNRKISVRFDNLSFQDGLQRILSNINHILLFDKNKEPSGVIIVGEGGSRNPKSNKFLNANGFSGTPNSEGPNIEIEPGNEINETPDAFHLQEPEMAGTEIPTGPDGEIPGGAIEITPQEAEMFMVVEDMPPPAGTVNEDLELRQD